MGDQRMSGPSLYWTDAIVEVSSATADSLKASYRPVPTANQPDVWETLRGRLPPGGYLASDQLDQAFRSTRINAQVFLAEGAPAIVITATGSELTSAAEALRESRHALDGYNAVQGALDKNDGVQRYLGYLDDHGHASVSIGDPDKATRSAIFVPGTGQDMATFDGSDNKSLKMYQATLAAAPTLGPNDVSVTTWMGYDRPMDLIEAADPEYAANGGSALDTFLDGTHASHDGPPAIDTVIGHSYGSTLVGGAATGGGHLAAENVIAVGSPGMLISHASDLNLEANANVHSITARNDIIHAATGMTLGADPFATDFGATRLEAYPGPTWGPGLPSVPAHSSYWDPGNPALENMGAIIAGRPPTHLAPPEVVR
ncbi:alpha/beta hydrolase [Mycolicibacterium fortuitum]|uniref:alpha/beta hydrolase n=1 Tax=Mycolicibacterium fortuitum TaxID=1766 RepID=UPI001AEF8004|nr:alpha/beta hydrolase [Mycolicibacterium fortuitum]MBP3084544.1 hypothetical protein [Mycolicibacterium fortuitum]